MKQWWMKYGKNWVYILNIFSTTNILYSSFTPVYYQPVSPLNESILLTKSLCVSAPVVTPRQNNMQMIRRIKLTLLQGGVMKRSVSLPSPPAAYVPPERKSTHQKPAYSAHPLEVNFSWSFESARCSTPPEPERFCWEEKKSCVFSFVFLHRHFEPTAGAGSGTPPANFWPWFRNKGSAINCLEIEGILIHWFLEEWSSYTFSSK
jgi:hypothetical protein